MRLNKKKYFYDFKNGQVIVRWHKKTKLKQFLHTNGKWCVAHKTKPDEISYIVYLDPLNYRSMIGFIDDGWEDHNLSKAEISYIRTTLLLTGE